MTDHTATEPSEWIPCNGCGAEHPADCYCNDGESGDPEGDGIEEESE